MAVLITAVMSVIDVVPDEGTTIGLAVGMTGGGETG